MSRLGRRLAAVVRAPAPDEVARAVEQAALHVEGDAVHVDARTYASIPTRDGRIALLGRARAVGADRIVLEARIAGVGSHAGRLVLDGPRRVLRAIGVPRVPDPGDRSSGDGFVHLYFDEEPLRREIAEAGLSVASHRGTAWVLVPGRDPDERADTFAVELARVVALAPIAERRRLREPPAAAVRAMRDRGARQPSRGPIGRARLHRAIGWVDAAMPGGENCYRRTLLELGLDAGAARETLVFGLDVGRTGHVAFKGREDEQMQRFDVVYELGPD